MRFPPVKFFKARKCVFCGSNADSKEHFWPTWVHEHLTPAKEGVRHSRELFSFHPTTGLMVSGPKGRQGDQRTIRIRAVCKRCNNEWMSEIEQAAQPSLLPIICGREAKLSKDDLLQIARWAALKTIIAEHDKPGLSLTPQRDRTQFMRTQEIPEYFKIFVAHNLSKMELYFLRHANCVALTREGPIPPLDDTTKNIQVITFVVGKAVIQTVCSRSNELTLTNRAHVKGFHDRCEIWPGLKDEMSFPHRPFLNEESIHSLATFFERYIEVSDVKWMPL